MQRERLQLRGERCEDEREARNRRRNAEAPRRFRTRNERVLLAVLYYGEKKLLASSS